MGGEPFSDQGLHASVGWGKREQGNKCEFCPWTVAFFSAHTCTHLPPAKRFSTRGLNCGIIENWLIYEKRCCLSSLIFSLLVFSVHCHLLQWPGCPTEREPQWRQQGGGRLHHFPVWSWLRPAGGCQDQLRADWEQVFLAAWPPNLHR